MTDDDATNTTIIGRLLEEISWEGKRVRLYRRGGRGMENVLTAEVLLPLSFLPRTHFLGELLLAAHQDSRHGAIFRERSGQDLSP